MVKLMKGDLISYKKSLNYKKRLGIVLSEPYLSKSVWSVKTYCDGSIYINAVDSVGRVCNDVEVIKPKYSGY